MKGSIFFRMFTNIGSVFRIVNHSINQSLLTPFSHYYILEYYMDHVGIYKERKGTNPVLRNLIQNPII